MAALFPAEAFDLLELLVDKVQSMVQAGNGGSRKVSIFAVKLAFCLRKGTAKPPSRFDPALF